MQHVPVAHGSPITILIVDDDADLREAMGLVCERSGFDVRLAPDAEAALHAIEESVPHLVLTDLRLPGKSGLDLLGEVRARHPRLPVIIMTAFGSDDVIERAGRLGAYTVLTKSVLRMDLVKVVGGALTA